MIKFLSKIQTEFTEFALFCLFQKKKQTNGRQGRRQQHNKAGEQVKHTNTIKTEIKTLGAVPCAMHDMHDTALARPSVT